MIRRFSVFLSLLPFFALADFSSADSQNILEIRNKMLSVDTSLSSIATTSGNSANYLNYIGNKVDSVDGHVNDILSDVYAIRNGFLTPYSTQYNQSALQWMWMGSKSVYDFLSGTKSFIPTIYYTSFSEDGRPVVSLTSMPYVGNYPDLFLSYLQERQHYDTISTVQSQQLQRENINTLLSVNKNISSVTNFLDTPVFNSGTSQTYEYDHLDPSSASMHNAPVVSTSTIQFTGGQNFIKWFGIYSKQMFQAVGRLNSSIVKQQYRLWDLQQKSSSITNMVDSILQYDIAQSNLLARIVEDNKKSSDVFSNLWVHTFSFPSIGSERFYFYTFPGSVSPSAWPDSTPSYVVSYEVPSSSSLTSILDSFHRNFLSVHSNFFKYLYSFQEQAKDIRSKLISLPSAISSALSGLEVKVVNTVDVSGISSSTNNFNWLWDKDRFDFNLSAPISMGPTFYYNIPGLDIDINSSVEHFLPPLTGRLNDDLPVLLGAIIKQNSDNNIASFSILTNLQYLVGLSKANSSITNAIKEEMQSDSDAISSQVASGSNITFLPNSFSEIPQNLRFTSELSSVANVSVSLPDEVVLDFQSFYESYNFLHISNAVSSSDFIFTLNVKPYHWFFRLMRGASIVALTVLVISFYVFLLRLFITICIFLVKLIHRSQDN